MQAIWKDFFVNLTSRLVNGSVEYRISTGGSVVYNGIAVADPSGNCIIRINDICADFLHQSLPALPIATGFYAQDIAKTFVIEYKSGNQWVQQTSVDFYLDWSYEFNYNHTNRALNDPIRSVFDSRAPIIISVAGTAMLQIKIRKNGAWFILYLDSSRHNSFNSDFDASFEQNAVSLEYQNGSWRIADSVLAGADAVRFNDREYSLTSCGRYVLYYVNAYGAWDSLIVNEHEKKKDTYNRSILNLNYDNRTTEARSKVNQRNEIVRSYTFRTPVLADGEAGKMHHLTGSTSVYLYDIAESRFYPVILTDRELIYKTFRNNGLARIQYEITCEVAHDMIRR